MRSADLDLEVGDAVIVELDHEARGTARSRQRASMCGMPRPQLDHRLGKSQGRRK
jgi:hypothetical protein